MRDTDKEWLDIFIEKGAYLKGHFCLSSGRHSMGYFQSALLLKDPHLASLCAQDIVEKAKTFQKWNVVVGPAIGSLIIGHEIAKHSDSSFLFMERVNGKFVLRRDFVLSRSDRVLVVEDVVTTGGSVKEVMGSLERNHIPIVGVVSILDRSHNHCDFSYPFESLASVSLESYDPENCPLCEKEEPLVSPGSRFNA